MKGMGANGGNIKRIRAMGDDMKGMRVTKKFMGQKIAYDLFTRLRAVEKLLDYICAMDIAGYEADVLQGGRFLAEGVEQFKLSPAELNEYAERTAKLAAKTHYFVPCYQKVTPVH